MAELEQQRLLISATSHHSFETPKMGLPIIGWIPKWCNYPAMVNRNTHWQIKKQTRRKEEWWFDHSQFRQMLWWHVITKMPYSFLLKEIADKNLSNFIAYFLKAMISRESSKSKKFLRVFKKNFWTVLVLKMSEPLKSYDYPGFGRFWTNFRSFLKI